MTAAGRPVTVVKRRWETATSQGGSFPAVITGTTDDGWWLRTDRLAMHRTPDGRVVFIAPQAWTLYVPRDQMWIATFTPGWTKVDVCLPAVVTADTVEFCDLEIDVVEDDDVDGVHVVDQDELDALGLDDDLRRRCIDEAGSLAVMVGERRGIFADPRLKDQEPAPFFIRHGWIAPPFAWTHERLQERFGWSRDDEDRTLIIGSRYDVLGVVVGGEIVGIDDTASGDGLDELAALAVEASERLGLDALASGV